MSEQTELDAEIAKHIKAAAKHEITLNPSDFKVVDGEPYLDGMDPAEWIDAMVME